MSNSYGRQVVLTLTNKSGGGVIAGDVVVVDTGNNEAFTTSTAGAVTGGVGIAQETIANNATGRVLVHGYAALVNTSASVTRGNYGKTHTVVKQAVDMGSSRGAGAFCQFLTGGTTPTARVFSPDLAAAAGNVATDAIWDAKGDLAGGTGADTAAKLTVGTNGFALVADSAQTTGLKWDQIPGTLIAKTIYAPSSTTVKSRASATMAEADTTNLRLTFTAPASGKVRIVLACNTDMNGAAGNGNWGLMEGGSVISGSVCRMMRVPDAEGYLTAVIHLSGVSAGSHSYDWALSTAGGGETIRLVIEDGVASGDFAPAVMEAWVGI
jgi:hypothetical protein